MANVPIAIWPDGEWEHLTEQDDPNSAFHYKSDDYDIASVDEDEDMTEFVQVWIASPLATS